jgi:hypothetical protein
MLTSLEDDPSADVQSAAWRISVIVNVGYIPIMSIALIHTAYSAIHYALPVYAIYWRAKN